MTPQSQKAGSKRSSHRFAKTLILFLVGTSCVGTSVYFAYRQYESDRKAFLIKQNETLAKTLTNEINLEISSRILRLKSVLPKLLNHDPKKKSPGAFDGPTQFLEKELLAVALFQKRADGKIEVAGHYLNEKLLEQRHYPKTLLARVYEKHPLPLDQFFKAPKLTPINRSLALMSETSRQDIPVLTILIPGSQIIESEALTGVAIDFLQEFVQLKLRQAEGKSKAFLLTREGILLSHPNSLTLAEHAARTFLHPSAEHIKKNPSASTETPPLDESQLKPFTMVRLDWGEARLILESDDIRPWFLVPVLVERNLALVYLGIGFLAFVLFSWMLLRLQRRKTTPYLRKDATDSNASQADKSGETPKLTQKRVSKPPPIPATAAGNARQQLQRILNSISTDAKPEADEAITPFSSFPNIDSDNVEFEVLYQPGARADLQIGETFQGGNTLTVCLGKISGKDPSMELRVAKSIRLALQHSFAAHSIEPPLVFDEMNRAMFSLFKGKVTLSLCVIQLNMEDGQLGAVIAGQQQLVSLWSKQITDQKNNSDTEGRQSQEFKISCGPEFGVKGKAAYALSKHQLQPGDILLILSESMLRTKNAAGQAWGDANFSATVTANSSRGVSTMKAAISEALNRYSAGVPQDDAMAVVFLGYQSEVTVTKEIVPEANLPAKGKNRASGNFAYHWQGIEQEPERRQELLYHEDFFDNAADSELNVSKKKAA